MGTEKVVGAKQSGTLLEYASSSFSWFQLLKTKVESLTTLRGSYTCKKPRGRLSTLIHFLDLPVFVSRFSCLSCTCTGLKIEYGVESEL